MQALHVSLTAQQYPPLGDAFVRLRPFPLSSRRPSPTFMHASMEVALTFGAVGDLLALGILIKDIISALDNCRGSSREYQNLQESLTLLDVTLEEIGKAFHDLDRVRIARELHNTGLQSIQQVKNTLTAFHSEKLHKFRPSLGSSDGSGNRLKDAGRKIQFRLGDKDIARFKAEITGHIVALNLLVEVMTL